MNISTLLQSIASFAWIGFIGVLVTIFIRTSRNQPVKDGRIVAGGHRATGVPRSVSVS